MINDNFILPFTFIKFAVARLKMRNKVTVSDCNYRN